MSDNDENYRLPTEEERREGRRMFAINMAVKTRHDYSETGDILAAAEQFLAFVEAPS
jgi:hypothetical protein